MSSGRGRSAAWREYEAFKREQAAELERSIAAAREERERGLAAERERKAAAQRRREWWAERWQNAKLLAMVVVVGVLAIVLMYVVKYEIIPTAQGLFSS